MSVVCPDFSEIFWSIFFSESSLYNESFEFEDAERPASVDRPRLSYRHQASRPGLKKSRGKTTGVGLSVVNRVAIAHGWSACLTETPNDAGKIIEAKIISDRHASPRRQRRVS